MTKTLYRTAFLIFLPIATSACGKTIDLVCSGSQNFSLEIDTNRNTAQVFSGIGRGFYSDVDWEEASKVSTSRTYHEYDDAYWLQQQSSNNYGHNTTRLWQIDIDRRSLIGVGYYDPNGGKIDEGTRFELKCRTQSKQI